jgi:hypothetical protein
VVAGEVAQAIGEAYQLAFIGALEANIRWFESTFDVRSNSEKTSFAGRNGKSYSFDFAGVYRHPWKHSEVFGECKGYSKAANLLSEYKIFLAKSFVTCTDYPRHRSDLFWFVTNVPFACSEGSAVRSFSFVREVLVNGDNSEVRQILAGGHIDDELVHSLVERLGVFILTDSYLMNTELSYRVSSGDTLWAILKRLHAGQAPRAFGAVAQEIATVNGLESPDKILSGRRIRLRWFGISRAPVELAT